MTQKMRMILTKSAESLEESDTIFQTWPINCHTEKNDTNFFFKVSGCKQFILTTFEFFLFNLVNQII